MPVTTSFIPAASNPTLSPFNVASISFTNWSSFVRVRGVEEAGADVEGQNRDLIDIRLAVGYDAAVLRMYMTRMAPCAFV